MQDSETGNLFKKHIGAIEGRFVDTIPKTAEADDDWKELESFGLELSELFTKMVKGYARRKEYSLEFRCRFKEVDEPGKSKLVIDAVAKFPDGTSDSFLDSNTVIQAAVGWLLNRLEALEVGLEGALDLASDDANKIDGELPPICPFAKPYKPLPGCVGLEVPNRDTAQWIKDVSNSKWLHKGFVVSIQDAVFAMPNIDFLADGECSRSRGTQDLTLAIGECVTTGHGVRLRQSIEGDNRASALTIEANGVALPEDFVAQVRAAVDGRLGPRWDAAISLRSLVGVCVECRLMNFYDRVVLTTQRPRFSICEEILRVLEGIRNRIQDDMLNAYG